MDPARYYPRKAKAEKRTGVVVVQVTVNPGKPKAANVIFTQSSAHADLDKAAIRAVRDTRFTTSCEEPTTLRLKLTFAAVYS